MHVLRVANFRKTTKTERKICASQAIWPPAETIGRKETIAENQTNKQTNDSSERFSKRTHPESPKITILRVFFRAGAMMDDDGGTGRRRIVSARLVRTALTGDSL
jgi:hypothetical protein